MSVSLYQYKPKMSLVMKRLFFALLVSLITVSNYAQVYLGGSFSFGVSERSTSSKTTFVGVSTLNPEIGYSFNRYLGLGTELGLNIYDMDVNIQLTPYLRWSFLHRDVLTCFVDLAYMYDVSNTKGSQLGLKPGVSFRLFEHLSLVAKIGFLGVRSSDNFIGIDTSNSSIGFFYTF